MRGPPRKLSRQCGPRGVGVHPVAFLAGQARATPRLDERADRDSPVPEDDRQVGDVAPEPATVAFGNDGEMADDHCGVDPVDFGDVTGDRQAATAEDGRDATCCGAAAVESDPTAHGRCRRRGLSKDGSESREQGVDVHRCAGCPREGGEPIARDTALEVAEEALLGRGHIVQHEQATVDSELEIGRASPHPGDSRIELEDHP